jgi:hypothetical protein
MIAPAAYRHYAENCRRYAERPGLPSDLRPVFHGIANRWAELAEIAERNPDLLGSTTEPPPLSTVAASSVPPKQRRARSLGGMAARI